MFGREKQRLFNRRERILCWTGGLLVCVCAILITVQFALSRAEGSFVQQASQIQEAITQRLGSLDAVLVSLASMHYASDALSQAQFTAFAQELLGAYPYLGTIVFLTHTSSDDVTTFVQDMRQTGLRQFTVTELAPDATLIPVARRPSYLLISSIEPLSPLAARFLGYDAASNPQLAPAIEQAVISGTVTGSQPLALFQPHQSIFVLKAVYQGRYAPQTSPSRRALLYGVIALELPGRLFLDDLLRGHRDFEVSLVHEMPPCQCERIAFTSVQPRRVSLLPYHGGRGIPTNAP